MLWLFRRRSKPAAKPQTRNAFIRLGLDSLEDRTVPAAMFRYPLDPTVNQRGEVYFDDNSAAGQFKDWNGGTKSYDGHTGTDFLVPNLSKVYAAAAGIVVAVGDGVKDGDMTGNNGAGNFVTIWHPDQKVYTRYYHLSMGTLKVAVNQSVSIGQEIGAVGLSGDTGGYHLHFETLDSKGVAFDPYKSNSGSWWLDQGSYLGRPSTGGKYLINDAFETGTLTGWTVTQGGQYPKVVSLAAGSGNGNYALQLGDGGKGLGANKTASIQQVVTVPSTSVAPSLNFKYKVQGTDSRAKDWMKVTINGTEVGKWTTDTNGWKSFTVDLSKWKGQSITIKFSSWTADTLTPVNYYLDDINVVV